MNIEDEEILDLSYQDLPEIPCSLAKKTNLVFLDLSNNSIEHLPDFLFELSNLEYLDLSGNNITQIPENILNLNKLSELKLHDNCITQIPHFLSKLPQLDTLSLLGNPFYTIEILSEEQEYVDNIWKSDFDVEQWKVYSDWLIQKNKPRGKLIALEIEAEQVYKKINQLQANAGVETKQQVLSELIEKREGLKLEITRLYDDNRLLWLTGIDISERLLSSGVWNHLITAFEDSFPFDKYSYSWKYGFVTDIRISVDWFAKHRYGDGKNCDIYEEVEKVIYDGRSLEYCLGECLNQAGYPYYLLDARFLKSITISDDTGASHWNYPRYLPSNYEFYDFRSKEHLVKTRTVVRWIKHQNQLRDLTLNMCNLQNEISAIGKLTNLESLKLVGCELTELPDTIGNLKKLELLDLSCNESLADFSSKIHQLERLKLLNISLTLWSHCKHLKKHIINLSHLILDEEDEGYLKKINLGEALVHLINEDDYGARLIYDLSRKLTPIVNRESEKISPTMRALKPLKD